MNKRTHLYLSVVIPIKSRLRRYAIYLMENAIDRLDIDKCHRYDDSYLFRDYVEDDDDGSFDWRPHETNNELFMFDPEYKPLFDNEEWETNFFDDDNNQ